MTFYTITHFQERLEFLLETSHILVFLRVADHYIYTGLLASVIWCYIIALYYFNQYSRILIKISPVRGLTVDF